MAEELRTSSIPQGAESDERRLAFTLMRACLVASYGLFAAGTVVALVSPSHPVSAVTLALGIVCLLAAPVTRLAGLFLRWMGRGVLALPAGVALVLYALNLIRKLFW